MRQAALTKNSVAYNRTLFIADNLALLESLDNESIDLICIDPPFAKNQAWVSALRPPLSKEERGQELATLADWGIRNRADAARAGIDWPDGENGAAKFQDIWRWEDDVHEDWVKKIEGGKYEALARTIEATRLARGEDTAAYLTYMAIRLIEMRRVLKSTGSIYLHCDYSANSYLRMAMDAVFGRDNMRNEIVWRRIIAGKQSQHKDKRFGVNTDSILFYAKDARETRFSSTRPLTEKEVEEKFNLIDERGERYYDDSSHIFRPSGLGDRPNLCYEWRGFRNPNPSGWTMRKERLEEEYQKGNFVILPSGKLQRRKYLRDYGGVKLATLWNDVQSAAGIERTGYPTQKPVALAERIIKASTNPGDIVLDCFAGCAYVPVAAERNGRQWIACDISPRALTVLRRQFVKFRYAVNGTHEAERPPLIADADVTVRSPLDLPKRTDEDLDPVERPKPLPERKFKVPASIIPEREMLEFLLDLSGYMAWCCGFAHRMPDGRVVRTTNNFHLDHIDPKSKDGSNQIHNRAPMCPRHNIRKKDRYVHLSEYRREIAANGEMLVNTTDELIDLAMAQQVALDKYALITGEARDAGQTLKEDMVLLR